MGLFNRLFGSSTTCDAPSANVDGTPMPMGINSVDVNGNPFGITSDDSIGGCTSDSLFSSSIEIDDHSGCGLDDSFSSSMDDSFGTGCGFDDW